MVLRVLGGGDGGPGRDDAGERHLPAGVPPLAQCDYAPSDEAEGKQQMYAALHVPAIGQGGQSDGDAHDGQHEGEEDNAWVRHSARLLTSAD